MRSQTTFQGIALSTAAMAAALLLTACGAGQPQSQSSTSPPQAGTASAVPSATTAPATASAPATSTASPVTTPSETAAAGPGRCRADALSAATDATGGGAAGSVYMKLNLTNTGTENCILRGFAGVSLTADAAGGPIGAPAVRDESTTAAEVVLAPGETGWAQLRYTQAGNYPDCSPVEAAGYRIYPPEDTGSIFLAQPTRACSNADIELLTIGPFQPA
jgi:hypothetical protein